MDYTELGLTKEQYEECIGLIIDKKINKTTDIDWQEICKKYNLPYCSDVLRKSQDTIFGGASVANYYMEKDKKEILKSIRDNLDLDNPGYGICFTIPLSGSTKYILDKLKMEDNKKTHYSSNKSHKRT